MPEHQDILIFDDDVAFAEMLANVLAPLRVSISKVHDGHNALENIRALTPRLIILDVMMPGMDGLSILQAVKKDPKLTRTHVIVVTAKRFVEERKKAAKLGATAFFNKPLDPQEILNLVGALLQPAPQTQQAAPSGNGRTGFRARIWGCYAPGSATMPTSCVTVEAGDTTVILDAGTGLGHFCASRPQLGEHVNILLTHYHPDHVAGLPYLASIPPPTMFTVSGPADPNSPLWQMMQVALQRSGMDMTRLSYRPLGESVFTIGKDLRAQAARVEHPVPTLAFRFRYLDKFLIYCPDNEPPSPEVPDLPPNLENFFQDADVLIHDARYKDADYEAHVNEGYGSPRLAVEMAIRRKVKRLVLFHMEPAYKASEFGPLLERFQSEFEIRNAQMAVDLARPGAVIEIA